MFWNRNLKLANSPYTTFTVLRRLAESRSVKIREAVAGNRNTQTYVLENLTSDVSPKVRAAVASNQNLTVKAWNSLRNDSDASVRESLEKSYPASPDARDRRA